MNVFIIGVTGRIGRLLAHELRQGSDMVSGLVRGHDDELTEFGVRTHLGDVGAMAAHELAAAMDGADVVVYTAGSNGGPRRTTESLDRVGVETAATAAHLVGVGRFVLVSVFPEAWRERRLPADEEFYFVAKKRAEVALVRTDLDWLILRPSLLTDDAGSGRIALGPAELHEHISRRDVAATAAMLLHEPLVGRQILELNRGDVPIGDAVARCALECRPDGRRCAGRVGPAHRTSAGAPSAHDGGLWFDPRTFATTPAPRS